MGRAGGADAATSTGAAAAAGAVTTGASGPPAGRRVGGGARRGSWTVCRLGCGGAVSSSRPPLAAATGRVSYADGWKAACMHARVRAHVSDTHPNSMVSVRGSSAMLVAPSGGVLDVGSGGEVCVWRCGYSGGWGREHGRGRERGHEHEHEHEHGLGHERAVAGPAAAERPPGGTTNTSHGRSEADAAAYISSCSWAALTAASPSAHLTSSRPLRHDQQPSRASRPRGPSRSSPSPADGAKCASRPPPVVRATIDID